MAATYRFIPKQTASVVYYIPVLNASIFQTFLKTSLCFCLLPLAWMMGLPPLDILIISHFNVVVKGFMKIFSNFQRFNSYSKKWLLELRITFPLTVIILYQIKFILSTVLCTKKGTISAPGRTKDAPWFFCYSTTTLQLGTITSVNSLHQKGSPVRNIKAL